MKPLHPLLRPFAPSNYQAPITQSNVWEVSAWLVGSDIDRMRDEGLLNDQTTGEEISRYVSQQDKALQFATLAGSLPDYYTPFNLPVDRLAEALGITPVKVYYIMADYYQQTGKYCRVDHVAVIETLG